MPLLTNSCGEPVFLATSFAASLCRAAMNSPSGPDVGVSFGQAGVDDPALCRRVLVVGSGEPGTIDQQLGRHDDLAALEFEVYQVALGKAGLAPDGGRDRNLTLVLNLTCCVHKSVVFIHGGRESQLSDGSIAHGRFRPFSPAIIADCEPVRAAGRGPAAWPPDLCGGIGNEGNVPLFPPLL